jgi:hypothetical protein
MSKSVPTTLNAAESNSACENHTNSPVTPDESYADCKQESHEPHVCDSPAQQEQAKATPVTGTSERKTVSNRLNSQRSTGAKTKEGKAHSRRNATKHGLLARKTLKGPNGQPREPELLEFYERLCAENPGGGLYEELLREDTLYAYAGYARAIDLENYAEQFKTYFIEKTGNLQRYLSANRKALFQNLKELKQLQLACTSTEQQLDRGDAEQEGDSKRCGGYIPRFPSDDDLDSEAYQDYRDACNINDMLLDPECLQDSVGREEEAGSDLPREQSAEDPLAEIPALASTPSAPDSLIEPRQPVGEAMNGASQATVLGGVEFSSQQPTESIAVGNPVEQSGGMPITVSTSVADEHSSTRKQEKTVPIFQESSHNRGRIALDKDENPSTCEVVEEESTRTIRMEQENRPVGVNPLLAQLAYGTGAAALVALYASVLAEPDAEDGA